jgi:hypothetical protein
MYGDRAKERERERETACDESNGKANMSETRQFHKTFSLWKQATQFFFPSEKRTDIAVKCVICKRKKTRIERE